MYNLTLTRDERRAFDWVRDRYNAGRVADILRECLPDDCEWNQEGDITFIIPEHLAWQIHDFATEENHAWPCFSPHLAGKMVTFCMSIV